MSNLFTRQKRSIGLAYPLPGADTLLAIDAVNEDIQLDTARMAATAIISTESFDRDGDIVEQAGLDFENYSKNPVVFFNHQAWPLPIGKSEDESGRLTVQKLDHYTTATCYFSQNSPQAEQIYHLVADKTLRGTSIGFLVKRAVPLQAAETLGMARLTNRGRDGGYRIQAAEVTEWSWVGIGANPDAVLVHLQKGLIAGRAIDERLKLALEPFAAKMHGGVVAVPAEFELLEKGGKFDPSKHPRGGRSENRGQFSSSSGSHSTPKKKPAKERPESRKPPEASGRTNNLGRPEAGSGKTDRRVGTEGTPANGANRARRGSSGPSDPSGQSVHSGGSDHQSYLAGLSIYRERPRRPATTEKARLELDNAFKKDPTIIQHRVEPTVGVYHNSQEPCFYVSWDGIRGKHRPIDIASIVAKTAKKYGQKDAFISKVLAPGQRSRNSRPGIEIYFKKPEDVKKAQEIFASLYSKGFHGFVLCPAPDRKQGEEKFTGIILQHIPEIAMRYKQEYRDYMRNPENAKKEIRNKTRVLVRVLEKLNKVAEVASAEFRRYDTIVMGEENYDEYIRRGASQDNRDLRSKVRFGKLRSTMFQEAASRLDTARKSWRFRTRGGYLLRGNHTVASIKAEAKGQAQAKKEGFLTRRNDRIRIHRSVPFNRRWFGPNPSKGLVPERFSSRVFSDFRAPVTRFLKALRSGPFRQMRTRISPAWAFLKNLSRAEVGPLIPIGGRPRSHRHYCIKCKRCQKRIFACRCTAQNKPVKWSTCDPCLGGRMVVKGRGASGRLIINLTPLVGKPKNDRALSLALKRIHKHHADYDLTRAQALTLSIAAHAIEEQVKGHRGERWLRLSAVQKLKVIERIVNSRPEASSKQAYAQVFTTIMQ